MHKHQINAQAHISTKYVKLIIMFVWSAVIRILYGSHGARFFAFDENGRIKMYTNL